MTKSTWKIGKLLAVIVDRMSAESGDESTENMSNVRFVGEVMGLYKVLSATVMLFETSDGSEPSLQVGAPDPPVEEIVDGGVGSDQGLLSPCGRTACSVR